MKFGRFPLREATGAILAHSLATPSGVIKKGRSLGAREIERLAAGGHDSVVAARLEPGDVDEDQAAARIAAAAAGSGARQAAPFTGRANLFAERDGLAVLDAEAIAALNAIDEGLTIATLAPFERVTTGQMLATVKVITFALPEAAVAAGEAVARKAQGLVRVQAFARKTAGLILTRMAATKAQVLAKRQQAIESRVTALGSTIGPVEIVAHAEAEIAAAITRLQAAGADPIILFAASAIVDRGDVIPAALLAAGGEIVRLGMPVDPGNLMLLGRLGPIDVIGAPSCAASPKLNGFDWILERRLAGLPVGMREVAGMGLGGLLKEIATRPQPRAGSEDDMDENPRRAPVIAALVLAAGRSTRFGDANKLTADVGGLPMVRRTVANILHSRARPVIAVTGHQREAVGAALAGLDVRLVHNPDFAQGLSTSLKAGLAALPDGIDGVMVCLGDMPAVTAEHIDRLISGFAPKEGRAIVVPVHQGKRGNPVLFAASFIAEMRDAAGDIGAKHVIGHYADAVAEVDLGSDAIFLDIDTQEALARMRGGSRVGNRQ
ncbi:MAG: NTP transferase domain-containing protein [Hyphomicrobiaceae bacterium]